jgi:lysyl endopeptidase
MTRSSQLPVMVLVVMASFLVAPSYGQVAAPMSATDLDRTEPVAVSHAKQLAALEAVPVVEAPPVDRAAVALEDEEQELAGLAPRFAIPNPVSVAPQTAGLWEEIDAGTLIWRLRVRSPGAWSLNLGFDRYLMPKGGRLSIYAADVSQVVRPFTAEDNQDHGQLWTPVVLADDIVVELTLPAEALESLELELSSINVGYRGFGETDDLRAGACNVDVICPEADPWRNEIPAVGVISTGGSTFCTGFMVNNTAQNQTPYFMTANHCGVNSGNAGSLVVYWNFYSPTCGQHGGGSLATFQTGSTFKATYSTSDFTLVQLNASPNPAWGITFAGWDRTSNDPTSAVGIHHPSTDEKSICFDYNPLATTSYLGATSPGDGTHLKVDWDLGVTEPGSSGSPMFDQNHHVVGQLHGGYSACGSADMRDWYGRFSRSWAGGGTNTTRLSNWLDPGSTGANSVDTLNPGAVGLKVTPFSGLNSQGNAGGPFTPDNVVYTLENQNATSINYSVTKSQTWVSLSNISGTLVGHATTTVTVSINSNANSLANGVYTDTVNFINTTDHVGDTTRSVRLQVGVPQLVYSFPMNTNPGWTTQGSWAFGHPTGGGGAYGGPDPANGYTGTNVYGYNLSGDYTNNMAETHLTSTTINCSNLSSVSLKFWRWLGVETSTYDHAYVRVSNNGSTYTTLWSNGSTLDGGPWVQDTFDISAVADNQATVYLRWTMGTTDGSWTYCGWNIDDVEIWGVQAGPAPTCSDGILNQGEQRIDCGGPCPACQCLADATCDDGAFCTGSETCDAYGHCQNGSYPCTAGQWCDEVGNTCVPNPSFLGNADSVGTGCNLLLSNGQSEPRTGGVRQLNFQFNGPPSGVGPVVQWATCANPTFQAYAGASVMSCARNGNDLRCTFTPALEGAHTYRFDFTGLAVGNPTFAVRALVGDVDSDGFTTGSDRTTVHANWGTANCAADVDEDGQVGGADRTEIHANWGACAP